MLAIDRLLLLVVPRSDGGGDVLMLVPSLLMLISLANKPTAHNQENRLLIGSGGRKEGENEIGGGWGARGRRGEGREKGHESVEGNHARL